MKRAEKISFFRPDCPFFGLSSVILLVPDDAAGKSAEAAADERAKEVAKVDSHTRPDGTNCFTVLKEYRCAYGSTLGSVVPVGAACATGENRGEKSDDAEFSHCFFRLRSAAPSAESGELPPL